MVKLAKVLMPVIWVATAIMALVRGHCRATDYMGVAILIPAMNLIGAGFVILAIHPRGVVNSLCKKPMLCRFGELSYGLYLVHMIYQVYFWNVLVPKLAQYMPHQAARLLSASIAFSITFVVALLASKFIEVPFLSLKKRFAYSAAPIQSISTPLF